MICNEHYFKVTCKCGHVGKKHFIRIDFPIKAKTKKEASYLARYLPRVKHDYKDAILDCVEIRYEEFQWLKRSNNKDPYLKCTNIQEQRCIYNLYTRIEEEPKYLQEKPRNKRETVLYRLKKRTLLEKYSFKEEF